MLEIIYRLLELLSLIICLHSLSGERAKLDIYNAGFLAIEMTFMQMIQDGIVSKQMYFVVYLIYFVYACIKFDDTIKRIILKCLLVAMIVGGLQMFLYIPVYLLSPIIKNEAIIVLIINASIFIIIFFTRESSKYEDIVNFCTKRDWILRICIVICTAIIVYCMYSLKKSYFIQIDMFILVSLFMIMFLIFLYRWQKSVFELKKKEQEEQIRNLYNNTFEDLIDTMRRRQHDFHNQIEAIYSSHLTANSLEELIELQKQYCDDVVYDSRYSKVLSCINDSVLSGFVYAKFIRAEKCDIEMEYDIAYSGNTNITIYDLVEIIGNLMDNAMEAVIDSELPKKIIFEMKDFQGLILSIKNPVTNISNNDISKFFEKEYTTKDLGSGIGLTKIKDYQKKYDYNLYVQLTGENEDQWIEFRIEEKK